MKYCIYIMASIQRTLYIGITSRLEARVAEHKAKLYPDSFTARYNVNRLVYVEWFDRVGDTIAREKQLKGWRREKKLRLIEKMNPEWIDFAEPPPLKSGERRLG